MQTGLSLPYYNNYTNFGKHYVSADIGASTEKGSLKMQIQTENGEIIATKKTTVFDNDEMRNEDTFESNVAEKIANFDKAHRGKILSKTSNQPYEPIVTICCPGACATGVDKNQKKYEGHYLSNIKYNFGVNNGQSFKKPINQDSVLAKLNANGLNTNSYIQANDMDAAGIQVLKFLQNRHPDTLKEGSIVLYLYPGGGLGNGLIMTSKDRYINMSTIKGTILEQEIGSPRIEKKDRASAGLIENFCRALSIDPKFANENAKIATNYEEFKNLYESKGLKCPFEKAQYNEASCTAIEKHMNALASIIDIQLCDGKTDTVVLMGSLINGAKDAVNKSIKENGHFKENYPEAENFEDVLKSKVYANTKDIRSKLDNFDLNIILLNTHDNTQYAHELHNAIKVGSPVKWYEFKKEDLSQLSLLG